MAVKLHRMDDVRWRIPREGAMRVDGIVFADDRLIEDLRGDPALEQVANVACLPGIVGASLAMPDAHWGYGFPIGGVAAFDADAGVISPGGVGYDINCGVRLLRTGVTRGDLLSDGGRFARLMDVLYDEIPSGVGSSRDDLRPSDAQLDDVLRRGAAWAVEQGVGRPADLAHLESGGCLPGADPGAVSATAKARGRVQLGTLGSGNHFCEVGYVDQVLDDATAAAFGLRADQVTVFVHTGSRGLGYQVCDDFLASMVRAAAEHGIDLPDRQLCCAPLRSTEGRRYLSAMSAAANFAFANRQIVTDRVRRAFAQVLGPAAGESVDVVYDVCHNIAKMERHVVDGVERDVCVHRKGATRAFPPGHPDVPAAYRHCGQPVLVPGDMGRYSYVLVGTPTAMERSFGSCCHGAGRRLSRTAARKAARGRRIDRELAGSGILVRAADRRTVEEEMPEAYKDVADVVDVAHRAGLARKVARIRPVGVVKG
jgi:tRNA-splicing ligase RtcB